MEKNTETQTWLDRLIEAVEQSGCSMRELSIKAGLSHGYLYGVMRDGKEPTISSLISICAALDVSPVYILHGYDVTPEDSEILELLHRHPEKMAAILSLISSD